MLLQFAVENYLSFRERAVLSMLADERVPHEPGQVLEGPGGRKVLRAAAVYGANGSGKSNLVKALGAVREMIVKGTRGDGRLPITPFKLDVARSKEPAHFEIELLADGKHYSYGFEATPAQVQSEWLYETGPGGEEHTLFEREAAKDKPRFDFGAALSDDVERLRFLGYVAAGTRQNQLFLAEAGERNVAELGPIRKAVLDWSVMLPDTPYLPLLQHIETNEAFRNRMALVLAEAGTGIAALKVVFEPMDMSPFAASLLRSVTQNNDVAKKHFANLQVDPRVDAQGHATMAQLIGVHRLLDGSTVELNFYNEESDGTVRLLHLATILHLMEEVSEGRFFAIDEIERSLHPLLTRLLLQLFFASAGKGAAAQLIFTTHDTNLLNVRILSRDSIWFIEKDARAGSVMYPLSELDQEQLDDVERQGKGLEKGYLQGRFGAIPFFGSLEALGLRKEQLK